MIYNFERCIYDISINFIKISQLACNEPFVYYYNGVHFY